jgi:hypothetical protein
MIIVKSRQGENNTEILTNEHEVFNGTAFENEDFSLTIQFGTSANVEQQLQKNIALNNIDREDSEDATEARINAIAIRDRNISRIVGWSGFFDEDGNVLECTHDNKVDFYENESFNEIFGALTMFIDAKNKPIVQRKEALTETMGNLQDSTDGYTNQDWEQTQTEMPSVESIGAEGAE